MHSKVLMSVSAMIMAVLGIGASFIPREIIAHFGSDPDRFGVLIIQIASGLYLGFSMLNWMARANSSAAYTAVRLRWETSCISP